MKNIYIGFVFVLAVAISIPHVYAQGAKSPKAYKVLGISVEGNTLADPAAIISNSGLKVGDEILLPGDQVAQAIQKLWKVKLFETVDIAVDRQVGDGIFLLIRVKELPRYERTEISGNDEFDEDDILKKVTLVRGQVLPPQDLPRIKKKIQKLYNEDGYLLTDVRVSIEQSDTNKNRAVLRIDIDEGPEVKVSHIDFEGNTAYDDGDLRGAMDETTENAWWKIFSSHKFDRKKYEEDKKLIVKFYEKHGYRDAEIVRDSIWYSEDKREMSILMSVHEGSQYKIRNIAWEGNTVYPEIVLTERLGFQKGDVFNAEKFEQNLRGNEAQSDVSSLFLDNGYLAFSLEPEETRVGQDSIDVTIRVYERNKFRVGDVTIKGNTKTYEKVIRRELLTVPGDYFSRGAIIRSVRQLSVLNYFNPEKITPDVKPLDDGETVNISYEVEEKSSDNINASVGYSGAFGFTGALGFTINNFSIREPLQGGAGQILNFEWQFGEGSRYRTFTIGFTEPWLFDTPTLLGVTLFDTKQSFNYVVQNTGGSVRVGRRFKWPDIYFRGDWILNAQHNDVSVAPPGFLTGRSSQVSLTQIISRNSVDNPIFPTSGSNFSLSTEIAGGPFLPGTIDFFKWIFQSQWYMPLFGTNKLALYLGLEYGFITDFSRQVPIPPNELFYMGGTGLGFIATIPLRGYDDQTVGPRDRFGRIIPGRTYAKHTAELRFAVTLNPIPIYLLAFAEQGNVFESFKYADFGNLKRSAGFGARLLIQPIGLLGFDYGFGFDDVDGPGSIPDGQPDGWRFHFIFGRGF
ncbi:MAG TPA: outer membrane protein assembly factor BamA [Bacteroidota bacterium]